MNELNTQVETGLKKAVELLQKEMNSNSLSHSDGYTSTVAELQNVIRTLAQLKSDIVYWTQQEPQGQAKA